MYGLYEGVPRTDYAADWAASPNRITLFRVPLEEDFPDAIELEAEVRMTVLHELAHHLGIDDHRLDELGAGWTRPASDGGAGHSRSRKSSMNVLG